MKVIKMKTQKVIHKGGQSRITQIKTNHTVAHKMESRRVVFK